MYVYVDICLELSALKLCILDSEKIRYEKIIRVSYELCVTDTTFTLRSIVCTSLYISHVVIFYSIRH